MNTIFPRNLTAPRNPAVLEISPHGKGSSDSKDAECRRTRAIRTIESRRETGEWTSRRPRNLAAGCSDLKLNLTAARFGGNTVMFGKGSSTYPAHP